MRNRDPKVRSQAAIIIITRSSNDDVDDDDDVECLGAIQMTTLVLFQSFILEIFVERVSLLF